MPTILVVFQSGACREELIIVKIVKTETQFKYHLNTRAGFFGMVLQVCLVTVNALALLIYPCCAFVTSANAQTRNRTSGGQAMVLLSMV